MVFLSLPLYKGQTITKLTKKRPKRFSRFMRHGTRGSRVDNGRQWSKRRPGIKMAEKGPKNFSCFMRHFPYTYILLILHCMCYICA